jgi:hypothetical protein
MSIFCDAIRTRSLLEFDYHGFHRVVAPYCHGTSTRGVEVLRAVQLRGASASGGFGFGKLWAVPDIIAPRMTGEPFVPDDPDYHPDDRAMKTIHCRI